MEDREWLQYVQDMTVQRPDKQQITTTVTVQKIECKIIQNQQTIKLHLQEN